MHHCRHYSVRSPCQVAACCVKHQLISTYRTRVLVNVESPRHSQHHAYYLSYHSDIRWTLCAASFLSLVSQALNNQNSSICTFPAQCVNHQDRIPCTIASTACHVLLLPWHCATTHSLLFRPPCRSNYTRHVGDAAHALTTWHG
jgi:hypothetical protein